jgi:tyrosine-protein kinase Etk/Wzc
LTEVYPLEKAVRRTDVKDLDFMSTGLFPHNPSELLLHNRFKDLLALLSGQYDVVLVDAPPILAVNDASLIAQTCGINLLVIPGGQLKTQDIEAAVRRFYADGVKLHGTIFNFVKRIYNDTSFYNSHYRYAKYYKRDQQ